jgi:hypothetical protein
LNLPGGHDLTALRMQVFSYHVMCARDPYADQIIRVGIGQNAQPEIADGFDHQTTLIRAHFQSFRVTGIVAGRQAAAMELDHLNGDRRPEIRITGVVLALPNRNR